MSKHLSVMRFLSAVLLLDIVLIGLVFVGGPSVQGFLAGFLPGRFGPSFGPGMSGDHLLCALLLHVDALLFLFGGTLVLVGASRNTLMIGSSGIWRLLRGTAGLSKEDIAATSFAVAEEQKAEIQTVHTGRSLLWIGALLLLLAFPAVCFTWAQADPKGAPLLQDAGGTVANEALSVEDVAVFALDQLADAVLLDIPRVYQLHVGSLAPAHGHMWFRPFVLLFHILNKLVVLATLFAAWRSGHLRAYLLQMAGLDAVPAAMSLRDMPPPAQPEQVPDEILQQIHAAVPELPSHDHAPSTVEHHVLETAPPVVEEAHFEHPDTPVEEPAVIEPAPEVNPVEDQPFAHDPPADAQHEETPAPEAAVVADAAIAEEAPPAETPPVMAEPIPVEPVHREPPPEEIAQEAPEAPAPVEASPPQPVISDAPLALHELKNPEDMHPELPFGSEDDAHHPMPYRNTALHLNQEFDA